MERQKHGFRFEEKVLLELGAEKTTNYTDKWDGYVKDVPVSVKVEKIGSDIELADYFRNAENDQDFILVVGFWEGEKDNIIETHILKIKGEDWSQLFCSEFNLKFKDLLSNITNQRSDDEKWKQNINQLKKEWKEKTSNLIRPRFKRDHKTQKRIQCAINNGDFYNYFIKNYAITKEEI